MFFELNDEPANASTSTAAASGASRFAGIERRMKERNDRKAQTNTALSKFNNEFNALQRGCAALVRNDASDCAAPRDELQERAGDATTMLQSMRDLLTSNASVLPPFDAAKAAKTIDELQAAVADFKQKRLPKKAFGFRSAVVPPPPPPPSVAPAESASISTDAAKGTVVADRHDCAVALKEDSDVTNDITLRNLSNCRVWIDANVGALRCDGLSGCTVMCGNVRGSMWVMRSTDCTFVGAAQQVRVAESHRCKLLVRTRSHIGIEKSDAVQVGAMPTIGGCTQATFEASVDDDDAWRHVQDFDWIKPTTLSPNWSLISDDDALKSVDIAAFAS